MQNENKEKYKKSWILIGDVPCMIGIASILKTRIQACSDLYSDGANLLM
jgi:hypothetical protein